MWNPLLLLAPDVGVPADRDGFGGRRRLWPWTLAQSMKNGASLVRGSLLLRIGWGSTSEEEGPCCPSACGLPEGIWLVTMRCLAPTLLQWLSALPSSLAC